MSQVGRNDPCPCGSGKKYKKCCEQKSYLQRKTIVAVAPGETTAKIASLIRPVVQVAEEVSLKDKEISAGRVDSKREKD